MSDTGGLNAADLSPELGARLQRAIMSLADSKRLMGIRYSDWLLGAPSIEAGIAASSMCQDEWGHARLLYAMLKEFGRSPAEVEHERPAEAYANVDCLDRPFQDWASVVVAIVAVDGAISAALQGFAEGRYEQARSRVPKMLAEEEFHADMGDAWFRRLAEGSDEAKARLVEACTAALPRALAWMAPEDEACAELVEAGIFPPPEQTRARFDAAVGPTLALAGLDVSSFEPDRTDWDEVRGRGPGHPDADTVARARGDLNRALLVE